MSQRFSLLVLAAVCLGSTLAAPLDDKIVGGVDANIVDYPYQLSFRYSNSHFCGASIISPNWALTAAHCCVYPVASTTLVAGSSTLSPTGTAYQVTQRISHPQYNKRTNDFDLCLLKVQTPFVFTTGVQSIELPAQGDVIVAGSSSTVTGWGSTTAGGSSINRLQVVQVPTTTTAACKAAYGAKKITARMFCAGFAVGGKDSCQGDSGGPLVINNTLVGATSWGKGCALPGYPGVYAMVSSMRSWIQTTSGV